ncbi:hypothetical protein HDIA_2055 [Hartmannibacter diazotrophicus]|uniref:Uncharacterized protein n=1 Tax=Hartmannibacter diazotrophicus TaxID=1482074 RepID=A0A2C9D5L5_9HYPH|nr:hypothetical protein [Hartmannibacter diazotrophicus]SON55596.1 hypothetical protein HDIA_2055 [Hartmannibacter diazotrophicus]
MRLASISLMIAGAMLVINFGLRWSSDLFETEDKSSDPTPLAVSVNGMRLTVPANMIRYGNERREGEVLRLDLQIHWPSLEGYTSATAKDFADTSATPPFFYLTIQKQQSATDSAGRLSSVYQHFFTDDRLKAPEGLVGRKLSEDSGLPGEEVYFEPGSTRPFTVHCMREDGTGYPTTCISEVNASGGLSVQLRFRRGLLPEWRELSRAMNALMVRFGVFPS